jgi:type II secretory pathway predicted ATPase ExeA
VKHRTVQQRITSQMSETNSDQLLRKDIRGVYIGLNIHAIKHWIVATTPFHADLEPFALVHHRAKSTYLQALEQNVSWSVLLTWEDELKSALKYVETLINAILLNDETTYRCNLQPHRPGAICPNRRRLRLPNPEIP